MEAGNSIAENILYVSERIVETATRCKRPPDAIRLMAVSKTQPASRVAEAWHCGVSDFGENYVQEAVEKMQKLLEMGAGEGITWHFIGPIQTNKTRDIAEHFHWVHSVEREKIALRLNAQRPAAMEPLNVCVQVNISGEASKSGLALADAPALCDLIAAQPRLRLRGLMAIPAPGGDFEAQRRVYRPLAAVFRELSYRYPCFDTLSIGMSADFEAAIAEGSTIVRIGSTIFGARN